MEAIHLYGGAEGARPGHPPETVEALGEFAKLWLAQGLSAEAESLLRRALAIREAALRPDHPDLDT